VGVMDGDEGGRMTKIINADCIEAMREMEPDSVDAIVTDPPYGLGFMGKQWDALPPGREWAEECLRVLKPGGHLLAFGGSRTWHRLAVAIEDAGFEIRDSIAWMYGSGFPKSLDVSKAIDKANGRRFEDRYALGRHIRERREAVGLSRAEVNARLGAATKCEHYESESPGFARVPTLVDWAILRPLLGLSDSFRELVERVEAEREVVGAGVSGKTYGMGGLRGVETSTGAFDVTAPATPDAERWQGWGTALKPAFEPIVVARKPLVGTVAANVLEHGTGALNIDGCRIGTTENLGRPQGTRPQPKEWGNKSPGETFVSEGNPEGRWPANVVLDESQAAALDRQSGTLKGRVGMTQHASGTNQVYGTWTRSEQSTGGAGTEDVGGASRFFYVARNEHRSVALTESEWRSLLGAARVGARALANNPDHHGPDHEALVNRVFGAALGPEKSGNGKVFHYAAKAPKKERPVVDGVAHPTVKPLSLMRWLVRLVTPPGGVVLDPFAGSGTTVEAALLEGFDVIGIEREADYLPLIAARINRTEGETSTSRRAAVS